MFWRGGSLEIGDGRKLLAGGVSDRAAAAAAKRWLAEAMAAGTVRAVIDDRRFEGLACIPDAIEHMLSGASMAGALLASNPRRVITRWGPRRGSASRELRPGMRRRWGPASRTIGFALEVPPV
jgi:hypothetical protein